MILSDTAIFLRDVFVCAKSRCLVFFMILKQKIAISYPIYDNKPVSYYVYKYQV